MSQDKNACAYLYADKTKINILSEVLDVRDAQVRAGHTADEDDKLSPNQWLRIVFEQMQKSDRDVGEYAKATEGLGKTEPDREDWVHMCGLVRDRLVKIAAAAIAGVEAIDRNPLASYPAER